MLPQRAVYAVFCPLRGRVRDVYYCGGYAEAACPVASIPSATAAHSALLPILDPETLVTFENSDLVGCLSLRLVCSLNRQHPICRRGQFQSHGWICR